MINRLLSFLNGVFKRQSGDVQAAAAPSSGLDAQAERLDSQPSADGQAEASANISSSIICREAMLNKAQKVAGYSFGLTHNVKARLANASALTQSLYDDALIEGIVRMNIEQLNGRRLVFITILPSSLARGAIEKLPKNTVVLVMSALAELMAQTNQYVAQITALKQAGFRFALQGDVLQPKLAPFIDLCEFVFLDVANDDLPTIKSKIEQLNKPNIIATNIKLLDEFVAFAKLPLQYFQGAFITQREVLASAVIDEGRMKILSLLNLIRQNADNVALIQQFKLSPALSFKLLRCVNAVGASGATKVNTIDQALIVLGRQNLYRWLCLLLFSSAGDHENPLDLAIMENALVRARLAELCAKHFLSQQACDEVFIAGIFSLLDTLLKMPIETILKQVSLPPAVEEALTQKSGQYAPYLELAIACEAFDQEKINTLSSQLNLDIKQIDAMQSQALIWALTVNEA